MLLLSIDVTHFRNFEKKTVTIHPSLTVIVGENARGKTNLLESIYFITHGSGFRESREQELIQVDRNDLRVRTVLKLHSKTVELQIYLRKIGDIAEKTFFVDKTKKKYWQFLKETVYSVLFSPEQIEIVTGSPDIRREYLDKLISFYDMEYKTKLTNYENALRKRNKILQTVYDTAKLKEELIFWDTYLITNGQYIGKQRREYISFLNENNKLDKRIFRIQYVESRISQEILDESLSEERRLKRTLIGPQKDDFLIIQKDARGEKELHHFGSRSEQRLAIFWLKLNEIKYYENAFKQKPILLLDDVFSELDHKNKQLILGLIPGYQTIMTTTEEDMVPRISNQKEEIHI